MMCINVLDDFIFDEDGKRHRFHEDYTDDDAFFDPDKIN